MFQLHWHSLPYQKTKQKQIITWDKKLTTTYIPAIISPDLAMTLKLLATRSIESPWVNNTSCSGCKPLFVKKEIINTLFVLYNCADEMKIGHFSKNSLLVIQLYYSSKPQPQQIYKYTCTCNDYWTIYCFLCIFFLKLKLEGIVYVKIYSKLSNGNEISPDLSLI